MIKILHDSKNDCWNIVFNNEQGRANLGSWGSEEWALRYIAACGELMTQEAMEMINKSAIRVRAGQRVVGQEYAGVVVYQI